ncbi:hypothetical protein V8C86DRAFT_2676453 [Haematococcus lacustris]
MLSHILAAASVLIAAAAALSSDDRDGAFVGYHEKVAGCLDRMEDCPARALGNGCAYDPFNLRSFCPVACDLEKCSHRGHKKVLHRGRATSHGTLAFQAAMVKQLNLPDSLYKSVKLLMSEEALALSGLGVGTYLGEGDEATDEASVAALLYSVTHGWNVIDTASNYRSGHSEQALGTALDALLAGDEAASFSQGTVEAAAALVNRYEITPPPLVSTLRGLAKPEDLADVTATVTASVLHKGADLTRDMLFISTKAGFTTPGLVERLVREGRLGQRDVVSGQHCLHPAYLEASLELSLTRLHLQTVDLFYLHNAAEMQLQQLGRAAFMARLLQAFHACEKARLQGKLVYYGLATWDCFRVPPTHPAYLALADVVQLAEQAGGAHHGFRFIQLPVNMRMAEAWTQPWQPLHPTMGLAAGKELGSRDGRARKLGDGRTSGQVPGSSPGGSNLTLMEVAGKLQVGVFSSGPLGEAGLVQDLAQPLDSVLELRSFRSTAAKLLQHARSTPGLITTLVGHKRREHVEDNLRLSYSPCLTPQQHLAAFQALSSRAG